MSRPWQPDRGDIVWLDFTPQAGTEQAGRRPALVLSPQKFNVGTGLMIACPVTSQMKGSPWEVPLPPGLKVVGAVLSDHLRSVDWIASNAAFSGKATGEVMEEVLGRIGAILGLDPA